MHIATIVYAEELNFLRLQARSFARFLRLGVDARIVVIVNDPRAEACCETIRSRILPEYGPHAGRVTVLDGRAVAPDVVGLQGYVAQQVLKLRHAAARADDCVTLDAKNFLISELTRESLFAEGDRPRCSFEAYTGPQAAALAACHAIFGVPPEAQPARMPAMMTPFVLRGALVRALIAEVEARSSVSLGRFLAAQHYPSEYLLYSAFLVHLGIDLNTLFAVGPAVNRTLWRLYPPGAEMMRAAFARAAELGQPVFAVHRRRMERLTAEEAEALHDRLAGLGLVSRTEERFWEAFEQG